MDAAPDDTRRHEHGSATIEFVAIAAAIGVMLSAVGAQLASRHGHQLGATIARSLTRTVQHPERGAARATMNGAGGVFQLASASVHAASVPLRAGTLRLPQRDLMMH